MKGMTITVQLGDMEISSSAGDIFEAAKIRKILHEVEEKISAIAQFANVDKKEVKMTIREGLKGPSGTFSKVSFQAYKDGKKYSIDLGVTDKNPLGFFVKWDEPIDVYDFRTKQSQKLPHGGNDNGGGGGGGYQQAQQQVQPAYNQQQQPNYGDGGFQQAQPAYNQQPQAQPQAQPQQMQQQQPAQPVQQPVQPQQPAQPGPEAQQGMANYAWQPSM